MLKPIVRKGNEKWRKEKLQERYHYLVMDFITLFFVVSVFFTASAQRMESNVSRGSSLTPHPPQTLRGCQILVSMPLDFTSKAMATLLIFLLLPLEFPTRL
jgi:hypothetical protein